MTEKTAMGMSKRDLVQVLGWSAALFGGAGVLAPRVLEVAYGIPRSPHARQLVRLFGTRMVVLAVWAFTARTPEERDRLLATAAGMNAVDAVTALAAARGTGGATAVRAAVTSAAYAAISATARSLEE
jgi:hypothetical protein